MKKQEMKMFEIFTEHLIKGVNIYSLLLKRSAIDKDEIRWGQYKLLKREYKELLEFARSLRRN